MSFKNRIFASQFFNLIKIPTGYQIVEQSKIHFLTFQVVYWIDVFSRKTYRDLFLESLAYCRKHKSLEVYGYVIMTNHIHLLVRSASSDLSGTVRDLKKFTSKSIVEALSDDRESRREWMLRLLTHAAQRGIANAAQQGIANAAQT